MFSSADGVCHDQTGQSVPKFMKAGLYSNNTEGESVCFDFCSRYMDIPGFAGFQWNDLEVSASYPGSCFCYFDPGSMPAQIENQLELDDWSDDNTGFGPLVGNGWSGRSCHNFLGMVSSKSSRYGSDMLSSQRMSARHSPRIFSLLLFGLSGATATTKCSGTGVERAWTASARLHQVRMPLLGRSTSQVIATAGQHVRLRFSHLTPTMFTVGCLCTPLMTSHGAVASLTIQLVQVSMCLHLAGWPLTRLAVAQW